MKFAIKKVAAWITDGRLYRTEMAAKEAVARQRLFRLLDRQEDNCLPGVSDGATRSCTRMVQSRRQIIEILREIDED